MKNLKRLVCLLTVCCSVLSAIAQQDYYVVSLAGTSGGYGRGDLIGYNFASAPVSTVLNEGLLPGDSVLIWNSYGWEENAYWGNGGWDDPNAIIGRGTAFFFKYVYDPSRAGDTYGYFHIKVKGTPATTPHEVNLEAGKYYFLASGFKQCNTNGVWLECFPGNTQYIRSSLGYVGNAGDQVQWWVNSLDQGGYYSAVVTRRASVVDQSLWEGIDLRTTPSLSRDETFYDQNGGVYSDTMHTNSAFGGAILFINTNSSNVWIQSAPYVSCP